MVDGEWLQPGQALARIGLASPAIAPLEAGVSAMGCGGVRR